MNGWVGSFGITLVHWDHKESDAGKEINRDAGGADAGGTQSAAPSIPRDNRPMVAPLKTITKSTHNLAASFVSLAHE